MFRRCWPGPLPTGLSCACLGVRRKKNAGCGGCNGRINGQSAEPPLADRVEMEVVRFIQKQPVFSFDGLDRAMCAQFTGLFSPPVDLIHAILDSYAEPIPTQAGSYRMRSGETSAARKADLQEMRSALEQIGQQIGYSTVEQSGVFIWENNGAPVWWFYRMAIQHHQPVCLHGSPRTSQPLCDHPARQPGTAAQLQTAP